jgi:hypothetical protein
MCILEPHIVAPPGECVGVCLEQTLKVPVICIVTGPVECQVSVVEYRRLSSVVVSGVQRSPTRD